MKYQLSLPASKVPYQGEITIPDLPPSVTPSFSGVVPIDDVPNQPPTANAGSDTTITLPNNAVILDGRGSDPEGSAVSFKWVKVSGSGNLLAPNAANCEVVGLTEGTSVFRLTVTDDKGATKTDDVTVTVKPEVIVVPPTPGKYEGFGVAALSALNQSNVISVDSKAKFEAALGNSRIIKFTNTNALEFTGRYDLNYSNLVIDANGKDVTINNNNNGDGISISGNKIILIGLRVINAGNDGINVVGGSDIIITNCSAYSNRDGNIDIAGGKNISVLNCIIGKVASGGSGSMLITSQFVTVAGNLISPLGSPSEGERCPFVHCNYSPAVNPNADIRNNVIMNWGRSGGSGSGYGTAIGYTARGNVVNNYYFDPQGADKAICNGDGYGTAANGKIHSAGNHITAGSNSLSATMANNSSEFVIPAANRITMVTALEAKAKVKAGVGTAVKNDYEKGLIASI